MRLSEEEATLLNQATEQLGSHQKIIVDLLISLCESYNQFRDELFVILKAGVGFFLKNLENENKPLSALYDFTQKKIFLNKALLSPFLEANNTLALDAIKVILKHETAHAVYHFKLGFESDPKKYFTLVTKFGIALFDALSCIDRYHIINKDKLDKIISLLNLPSSSVNGYPYLYRPENNTAAMSNFTAAIERFGYATFPSISGINCNYNYVLRLFGTDQIREFFIYITKNVKRVKELAASAIAAGKVTKDDVPPIIVDNPDTLAFWDQLTPEQANGLDRLFILKDRILVHFYPGPVCLPELEQCMQTGEAGCLNTYLNCTDIPRNPVINHYEIQAVFEEYTRMGPVSLEDIENLCTRPPQSVSAISYFTIALNGFLYSSVQVILQTHLERSQFTPNTVNLLMALFNIYILLSYYIGSRVLSFLHGDKNPFVINPLQALLAVVIAAMPLALLLTRKSNHLATSLFVKCFVTALTIAFLFNNLISKNELLPSVKTIGIGATGCTLGSLAAKSLSKALGWKTPHQIVMQEIATLLQDRTSKEIFKNFTTAMRSKDYAEALRLACSNKHPKAYSLVEVLAKHKKQLFLDFNNKYKENKSALHFAAQIGREDIFDCLSNNSAVDTKDSSDTHARTYLERAKADAGFIPAMP